MSIARRRNRRETRQRRLRERVGHVSHETPTASPAPNVADASTAAWKGPAGSIGAYIREESENTLSAYCNQPNLVHEHANHEEDTARGGYAHRQLFELVQNSADALVGSGRGRILIRLTPTHLYCADEGRPIDNDGVRALMFSHLSSKRGTAEIGRFGLGFKSVLGVTDTPEFFSRSGSFRFDRTKAVNQIQAIGLAAERYPVLRLPEAVDPWQARRADPILHELMAWAVNIIRLPLKSDAHQGSIIRGVRVHGIRMPSKSDAYQALAKQIEDFPPEFLLFVEHVSKLELLNETQSFTRKFSLSQRGDKYMLTDGSTETEWMITKSVHTLSPEAMSDSRALDNATEVPLTWAVPTSRLNEQGLFWSFFPTLSRSLLSGILNAPWKTNEDRQNLLPGAYNDELIDAAAELVARALPSLATEADHARHLSALPRREETGDSDHSKRLRDKLYKSLRERPVVPDQKGKLAKVTEISYPPPNLTGSGTPEKSPLQRWAAYEFRPSGWLHHRALTPDRIARLDTLYNYATNRVRYYTYLRSSSLSLPRSSIARWLEALAEDATSEGRRVQASMAAVQTASLIPDDIRESEDLGSIVLTSNGDFAAARSGSVFLGTDDDPSLSNLVHPQLQGDPETMEALRALGIEPISPASKFKDLASTLLGPSSSGTVSESDWIAFWKLGRDIEPQAAANIVANSSDTWRSHLRVRAIDGVFRSLFLVLLPGSIVPDDGSRDECVAIDVRFHESELSLLKWLGALEVPRENHELSSGMFNLFVKSYRQQFTEITQRELHRTPRENMLNFDSTVTSGPLEVLSRLSEKGRAIYTWRLLDIQATYEPWHMRHDTQDLYGQRQFESPALQLLRALGRIQTDEGIHQLSDGLEDPPRNRAVLHKLLSHPQAASIREAFGIKAEMGAYVEPVGAEEPSLLIEIWPGLERHLSIHETNFQLIRCDDFTAYGSASGDDSGICLTVDSTVYLKRQTAEQDELRCVLREMGRQNLVDRIDEIINYRTPEQVREARDAVRQHRTDDARLLAAVGEVELRRRLPEGLITILEQTQGPLTGIRTAQAAIATFHTGVLREYRSALSHLDPPKQWAGRLRTIEFVRSLGFGEEWAGQPNTRRDPYVQVDGPYSLPKLHGYQRKVVGNVRRLLESDGAFGQRRGMISMPTGSGKTRVAVQAIVEAMREDGFRSGILWVADRDELCEQAVEAWRQVWASEGAQATQLRISRLWAGQPRPLPSTELHVIVATIQTLVAKINRQPEAYEFLADFRILVFDEAHRSITRTSTQVMQELGLTRWRRSDEPFLLGLTATPYRGHSEEETNRLVNRYGKNRLDSGAFESDNPEQVIRELQDMSILARAYHKTIEGGTFSLSYDELSQLVETPWLPESVERRIGDNTDRTQRIVEAYLDHIHRVGPDWPTLIFATSVDHSRVVAALLSSRGIKARSVSGKTDAATRRRVVDEFRAGDVKALVNYGVFREGFDAPKTRAIIVARPVYSPNLYFQMIGRGLRGVKNGGNDQCLILNVEDNIENFEQKLAFTELDWLWA